MDIRKLKQFLIQAKQNTYASGGESEAKLLFDGRKEYIYQQNDFKYVDIYKGHEEFTGKEEVFLNDKLIWQMEYNGKVLLKDDLADDVYLFLRKSLKIIPEDMPFRGPKEFIDGKYRYINIIEGNIKNFFGEEQIFCQNELVYKLKYEGLLIKK